MFLFVHLTPFALAAIVHPLVTVTTSHLTPETQPIMFTLKPNQALYQSLFDQWEREDALRAQQEAASSSFLASRRNQIVLLLLVALAAIMQIALLLLQRRLANKCAARRRWALRTVDHKDVEGGNSVITLPVSGRWQGDVKSPFASGDE